MSSFVGTFSEEHITMSSMIHDPGHPVPETTPRLMTTLVLEQHAFEDIVRRVILDRGAFATAQVRRRRTNLGRELIIDRWSLAGGVPPRWLQSAAAGRLGSRGHQLR
ncbi:MAG: hypothetical protein ACI8P0_001298 [Planctomycetaceae bacterium]|jgi:hypothetical protein